LVALQFGGTSEIAQGTTRIVADGQIQPVSLKHFYFFLKFRITVLTKTGVKH